MLMILSLFRPSLMTLMKRTYCALIVNGVDAIVHDRHLAFKVGQILTFVFIGTCAGLAAAYLQYQMQVHVFAAVLFGFCIGIYFAAIMNQGLPNDNMPTDDLNGLNGLNGHEGPNGQQMEIIATANLFHATTMLKNGVHGCYLRSCYGRFTVPPLVRHPPPARA